MKVFISWSGELSRAVAQSLRDWLPMVVQHVEPWMSDEDIDSGGRWNDQIGAELERADYGLICLTSTNRERPWLLFEAGALAKRFDTARVVPILIDLKPRDVAMPLASFQARRLSEEGMLRLVADMNAAREQPMPSLQIDELFAGMWPALQMRVRAAMKANPPNDESQPPRKVDDVMDELVETVRRIDRRIDTPLAQDGSDLRRTREVHDFSKELMEAVGRLQAYREALVESRVQIEELEAVEIRCHQVLIFARHIGLAVDDDPYGMILQTWRRHYGLLSDPGTS